MDDPPSIEGIHKALTTHEARSQLRYESILEQLNEKGDKMGMDNVSDKVNINVGDGGGGGGMGPAMIAALLNGRNQDGGMAALAPLLANAGNNGMNNIWPILLLALLGRGRGGLLGGDEGGAACAAGGMENRIEDQAQALAILSKLGSIEAAIPLGSAQTENVILQQTNALNGALASLALGTQQGFATVKDSVQATSALQLSATANVNQNVLEQACQTRAAVAASTTAILQKIDQNTIDELRERTTRSERQNEINALRSQVEVTQTVNTTQAQAQGQFQVQAQVQDIARGLAELRGLIAIGNQLQIARTQQDIVNLGTMTGSGVQSNANTQVR